MLRKSLILIGLFVALVPYLGLPQSIDTVILTFSGTTIVILLLIARSDRSGRNTVPPVSVGDVHVSEKSPLQQLRKGDVLHSRVDHSMKRVAPKELHVERSASVRVPGSQRGAPAIPTIEDAPLNHLPKREPRRPRRIERTAASIAPHVAQPTATGPSAIGIIPEQESESAPVLPIKSEVRRRRKNISGTDVVTLST